MTNRSAGLEKGGVIMQLAHATVGQTYRISSITDEQTALMAIRLGLFEGETIQVMRKIPGGPFVLLRGASEIALGRALCQHIVLSAA